MTENILFPVINYGSLFLNLSIKYTQFLIPWFWLTQIYKKFITHLLKKTYFSR